MVKKETNKFSSLFIKELKAIQYRVQGYGTRDGARVFDEVNKLIEDNK